MHIFSLIFIQNIHVHFLRLKFAFSHFSRNRRSLALNSSFFNISDGFVTRIELKKFNVTRFVYKLTKLSFSKRGLYCRTEKLKLILYRRKLTEPFEQNFGIYHAVKLSSL